MEVPISSNTTTWPLTWEYCPEELLLIIFRKLDYQSLLTCMTVNRRWKVILLDYIEHYSLWPKIFLATIVHNGRTFKRNSVLSLKGMCMNSMLWTSVPQAKITLQHTYTEQNVTCIHVYKDTMILTTKTDTDRPIKYYNIKNSEVMKTVASAGVKATTECRENDHMFVYAGAEFRAFGKETPLDTAHDLNRMVDYSTENVVFYKMEDNVCYIYISSFFLIFALTWNRIKWKLAARGRYYGNTHDTVCGINVFNGRVCLITKLGFIMCEDLETKNYHKVNSRNLLTRIRDSTVLEMFDYNKVAVSVINNGNQRVAVCHKSKSDFMWLSCEKMTCCTQHGAVLFIGFKDGAIAIYTPPTTTTLKKGQMSRLFNVKDFDSSIQQPSICRLEVFEDTLSHHLLVVTREKVLQLLFTYPEHIRACYE